MNLSDPDGEQKGDATVKLMLAAFSVVIIDLAFAAIPSRCLDRITLANATGGAVLNEAGATTTYDGHCAYATQQSYHALAANRPFVDLED